jgi:hypothetical protein
MVVSAMFPISAGARTDRGRKSILAVPVTFVLAISAGFVALMAFFPDFVLRMVFGSHFVSSPALNTLLVLYAAMAGVYSLSVVLITYEMSRRIANTGWWQLLFSGAIVVGIYLFHATLRQVVLVQLVMMAGLLIVVALPFLRRRSAPALAQLEAA